MRKTLLALLASAALAFGVAGQASARDYHGGGHRGGYHNGHHERHWDRGHHRHHYKHQRHHRHHYKHHRHYRPYYSSHYYSPYVYGPPVPYYGGYGYGIGYSQPGFGIYIGR